MPFMGGVTITNDVLRFPEKKSNFKVHGLSFTSYIYLLSKEKDHLTSYEVNQKLKLRTVYREDPVRGLLQVMRSGEISELVTLL